MLEQMDIRKIAEQMDAAIDKAVVNGVDLSKYKFEISYKVYQAFMDTGVFNPPIHNLRYRNIPVVVSKRGMGTTCDICIIDEDTDPEVWK